MKQIMGRLEKHRAFRPNFPKRLSFPVQAHEGWGHMARQDARLDSVRHYIEAICEVDSQPGWRTRERIRIIGVWNGDRLRAQLMRRALEVRESQGNVPDSK